MAFEVVEFRESSPQPGRPFKGSEQNVLGMFNSESEAIEQGRSAWRAGKESDTTDVMWWIVRGPGETLCRWIADRGSDDEQILDLTTNSVIPLR